jgi:hypothetical protein
MPDRPVHEQHEIHEAAADEVRPRALHRPRERNPGDAEKQMDDVHQHADVEDPEQLRV